MDKNFVVLENLSKMPITKGEQNVISEAINDKEKTKIGNKVIEYAYRYALLVETNVADSKRGEKYLNGLKKCCQTYVNDKYKDNTK